MSRVRDIWRRITAFGKLTPLQRAVLDLEEAERKRYEVTRNQEENAAYLSMLDKREKALRALIDAANKESTSAT